MAGVYYSTTLEYLKTQEKQYNDLFDSYNDKLNKLIALNEKLNKLEQSYQPTTEKYVDSKSTKKTVKTSNSKKTKKVSKSSKNKKVKKSTKTSKKSTKSKTSSKGGKVTVKSGKSSNTSSTKTSKKPPKDRHGKGKKGEAQVVKPKGQRKISKKKLVKAYHASNDYNAQLKKAQKMRKNNSKNVKKGQGSKFLKKAWKWLNQPSKMSG